MRFGVKEVANVTFYDLDDEPVLFLDSLKMTDLENSAESVYSTGGQGGGRLVGWDYGRTATFAVQDALLNPKAVSMQLGTELVKGKEVVHARDVVTGVYNSTDKEYTFTLEHTPITGTALKIFVTDETGREHVRAITTYTASANTVTIAEADAVPSDLTSPDKLRVLVYYKFETVEDAEVITISSDKFSGFYKIVGDTIWRNEATGRDELVQFVAPKVKITSNFTIAMQSEGEPSVFDFNLDVFKAPNSTDMVKFVRYTK